MDYTRQSLGFKIAKVLRYVRLYGLPRTRVKVCGQIHMKRRFDPLPERPSLRPSGGHVGIIGCGTFAYTTVAYMLTRFHGRALRGCMDVDLHHAASLARDFRARYYTDDAEELLRDPEIDLVFVTSNHASHAEYAIDALRAGKAVHVEKPHCVDDDQLRRLCETMVETGGKLRLGFNRPDSDIGRLIRQHLDSQPGAAMLNWFIAGHSIDPDHWYFRPEEGGRVLGNLCHWIDFVLQAVPEGSRYPVTINPTSHWKKDSDVAVTYVFGDGTVAALTFSAKGHTFEGVRERFAAHKGNVLISMDDFKRLTVEIGARKRITSGWFRDHGHQTHILGSYAMANGGPGEPVEYVWNTGLLSLETRRALKIGETVTVQGFPESFSA